MEIKIFSGREGPPKFTSNVLFLRKLLEDVLHESKGVKNELENRGFNITPRVTPCVSVEQQTWTAIRWDKKREGSRGDINEGDKRN